MMKKWKIKIETGYLLDILNIKYTNTPVIKKVIIVPNVDIKIEGAAFGLAMLQLVPNPP